MAKKDPEETEGSEDTSEDLEESAEEETEESSEESDSESESSDEEEGVDQFYDPNKVPPNLKGAFKKMQASYVSKMQKFSDAIRKGAAFDELSQIPEFKLFITDMDSGRGYGASSPYANSRNSGKSRDEGEEDGSLEGTEGKLNMKELVKALTPVLDKLITDKVGPLYEQEGKRSLENLRERHPDFDHYLPEITALRKEFPGMSHQRAYELVSGSSKRPRVDQEAVRKGKKARTEGASSSKGSMETLSPKAAKTVREALAIAAREQGLQV